MIFPSYDKTKRVYHVVNLTELDYILKNGIKYNDKNSYESKYIEFHKFIDNYKSHSIPNWVIREKSIFASLNFEESHKWHSHSVILGLTININKCWYANENLANEIYEPFILKDVIGFECAENYLYNEGLEKLKKYWNTSMDLKKALDFERNKPKDYDGEILILHDINPTDIEVIAIISDHKIMSPSEWKKSFLC